MNNSYLPFPLGIAVGAAILIFSVNTLRGDVTQATTPAAAPTSLSLEVGRSKVIKAQWPVTRVSVANPKVADVQILSPTDVLVVGNETGITDLYLWNEKGDIWEAQVQVEVDLKRIEKDLKTYFPTADITLSKSNEVVVARGVVRRVEDVKSLDGIMRAAFNDPDGKKWVNMTSVAGVQQVLVKVKVVEADRNAMRSLGFDLQYNGKDIIGTRPTGNLGTPRANASSGGAAPGTLSLSPQSTLFGIFPQANLDVVVEALVDNKYIRVLAEPSLVALSGEEASFLAGGEFPIPVVQGSVGGATTTGTSLSVEFREFGVRLGFRPTVLGDGRIRIKVAPEVSELTDDGAVDINGFHIPALRTRKSETTMEMGSGQSFAMAGLLKREVNARTRKLPGMGELPVLGTLFRSVRYERGETEMVVLATVELVEPTSLVTPRPLPGDSHVEPSDWELYVNGQINGRRPASPAAHARAIKEMGLDALKGPGAWDRHE